MAVDSNQQNPLHPQQSVLEDTPPAADAAVETRPEGQSVESRPRHRISSPIGSQLSLRVKLARGWLRTHRKGTSAALTFLVLLAIALPILLTRLLGSPPHVTVYSVHLQTLTSYVGGGGLTYPVKSLDIAYPVSAQVIAVNVQIGQAVVPGQPLLTLDSAGLTALLQEAYDEWQTAQRYLADLINSGAPAAQVAAAQQQVDVAKSRYDALNAQLSSPSFNNGKITAPFAGIVTLINVTPGTLFRADTTLLTLQDVSKIIVRAQFPLEQRAQIQVGESVEVDPASIPDQHFTGLVTGIDPALSNAGSATFEALISVANPDQALFTGETVYVRAQGRQVLPAVPELAVINPESDSIVFVYAAGKAHLTHVVIGARDGDRFGIISGLRPGDQVILVGLATLSDDEPVIVVRTQS
jgi:membrane fusion protein (multidrug efflux system)